MRTTINELVGRRGGAHGAEELESILDRTRKLLADVGALLELEIERLCETEFDPTDKKRQDGMMDLMRQTYKAMGTITEIEAKLGIKALDETHAMDLEAARDEILRRLSRLAAAGDAPGIPEGSVEERAGGDAVDLEDLGESAPSGRT